MTTANDIPPFIDSQGFRLLMDTEQPQRFLRAEYFRSARLGSDGMSGGRGQDLGHWIPIGREELASNQVTDPNGSPCDLSRLVVTTDAGVGKTTNLRWLHYALNRPGSDTVAFLLDFGRLPVSADRVLDDALVPLFRKVPHQNEEDQLPEHRASQILAQLRQSGRLVLLLDALDQAPADGPAVDTLCALLDSSDWHQCRIVIGARPHALQRHWDKLFDAPRVGWRFVQLDEFDEDEQRLFLGNTADGRSRYHLVPEEAREILSVPRVLEYLRKLPDGELAKIRAPSDVYWQAANHMIKQGMKNSERARMLGLSEREPVPDKVQARSLDHALKLLGAIAFQMTSQRVARRPAPDAPVEWAPNFDRVGRNTFAAYKDELFARIGTGTSGGDTRLLNRDLDCLAAMNDILAHGFFETDVEGLNQILWRNRTLQEFFTAYWLSQHFHDSSAEFLWEWIYLPEDPLTEEYYWVWRFACEMPDDAANPNCWVRAMSPLYRSGDGTAKGTKRSCEMIYRSWQRMEQLRHDGHVSAGDVLNGFLSEFEEVILAGARGDKDQETAQEFHNSFLEVPAGEFRMGAPPEKQGMPPDLKDTWQKYLEQDGDPAERAEQYLAYWIVSPGKADQKRQASELQWWTGVFRNRDLAAIERLCFPPDETPEDHQQKIDGFLLCPVPTVNAVFRLFAPEHGVRPSWYQEEYEQRSAEERTPAIFVNWYDAWVFCRWAHWDGQSCRLPREHEWEYAAKAGTNWEWNYWWGDGFDQTKCNANQHVGHATPPTAEHANPWGFQDMLGNVWEWCQDQYRRQFSLSAAATSSARVLRGGSWLSYPWLTRSAFRDYGRPSDSDFNVGFRVARALPREP